MGKQLIHPTAIIEEGAKLGKNVTVEPYAVVKEHVVVGDNVTIRSHAYIDGYTTIGENTVIFPMVSIGTKAQAIKYQGERTYVEIGKNCQIREFVTINSSLGAETKVKVGDNCLIMAYCHIAHNSEIGDNVIMSNNATLAGHVTIGNNAVIGGMTPIHQFVQIGCFAMVGGLSRVTHDVSPYTIGAGIPFKFGGLNLIGLKRNGFDFETRRELSLAFKYLYRSQLHLDEAIRKMETELKPIPEIRHWIDFCKRSKRGLIAMQGVSDEGIQSDDQLEI